MQTFGYMWSIIRAIYIRSLEDQSNDQSKIPESSSFEVKLWSHLHLHRPNRLR
jgi:hypothetical protein